MQKATFENENEKAKQFSSMAQETVSALASTVTNTPAQRQDDEIYSLASKMIIDGSGEKSQAAQSQEVGQPAGEDNTLVANKEGSNLQMV